MPNVIFRPYSPFNFMPHAEFGQNYDYIFLATCNVALPLDICSCCACLNAGYLTQK